MYPTTSNQDYKINIVMDSGTSTVDSNIYFVADEDYIVQNIGLLFPFTDTKVVELKITQNEKIQLDSNGIILSWDDVHQGDWWVDIENSNKIRDDIMNDDGSTTVHMTRLFNLYVATGNDSKSVECFKGTCSTKNYKCKFTKLTNRMTNSLSEAQLTFSLEDYDDRYDLIRVDSKFFQAGGIIQTKIVNMINNFELDFQPRPDGL